jgi:hypothetical protein
MSLYLFADTNWLLICNSALVVDTFINGIFLMFKLSVANMSAEHLIVHRMIIPLSVYLCPGAL